jgi:hypothetical protein
MTTAHLTTIAAEQHQQDLLALAAESRRAATAVKRDERSERPRRRRFAFPRRRPAIA